MKTIVVLLVLLSLAFGCSGCGLSINMPANRFESPETNGAFLKGTAEIGSEGANEIVVSQNITKVPPTSDPQIERYPLNLTPALGLGLLRRLDLSFRGHNNTADVFALKFQFLGEPRKDAEEGNFAAAVSAGLGNVGWSAEQSRFWKNEENAQYEVKTTVFDIGLIAGFRFQKMLMVYGGPFYSQNNIRGQITQPKGSDTRFHFSGLAVQKGMNLGVSLLGEHGFAKAELAYAKATYNGQVRDTVYPGVSVGFMW